MTARIGWTGPGRIVAQGETSELLTRPENQKTRKPAWAWKRTNEATVPCNRALLLKR